MHDAGLPDRRNVLRTTDMRENDARFMHAAG